MEVGMQKEMSPKCAWTYKQNGSISFVFLYPVFPARKMTSTIKGQPHTTFKGRWEEALTLARCVLLPYKREYTWETTRTHNHSFPSRTDRRRLKWHLHICFLFLAHAHRNPHIKTVGSIVLSHPFRSWSSLNGSKREITLDRVASKNPTPLNGQRFLFKYINTIKCACVCTVREQQHLQIIVLLCSSRIENRTKSWETL